MSSISSKVKKSMKKFKNKAPKCACDDGIWVLRSNVCVYVRVDKVIEWKEREKNKENQKDLNKYKGLRGNGMSISRNSNHHYKTHSSST